MAKLRVVAGGSLHGNVCFLRVAEDWEVGAFIEFFNLLYSTGVSNEEVDKMCWIPSKKGKLVHSCYKAMTI